MRQASVGFQCPECVREGKASSRPARTAFGGRLTYDRAAATITLIALNVVVFVIAWASGGLSGPVGKAMVEIPDATIYRGQGVEGIVQGAYWELISSTFLHFAVLHIALNMLGLWIFGGFLESQLGRWRFVSLYLVTGFIGSVGVYLVADPASVSYGASGSVFGLFGAAFVLILRRHGDITYLVVLLVLNLVVSFTVPNIAWQAHVGGLLSGALIGAVFSYAPRQQRTAASVGILVAVVFIGVVVTALRTAALAS